MEKFQSKTYQQGDVVLKEIQSLLRINAWEKDNKHEMKHPTDKIVLALGEATGHHHRFEAEKLNDMVSVVGYGNRNGGLSTYVEIDGGSATLYHEEHDPLELPPAIYQVSIVQEMDHISGNTRTVMD